MTLQLIPERGGGCFRSPSKLLFFYLLSFPLVLSAVKTVSWLWWKSNLCILDLAKIQLNCIGGGGQISPGRKTQLLKNAQLFSCTAATKGHIFWYIMFFPLDLIAVKCIFGIWRKSNWIISGRGRSDTDKKYMSCQIIYIFVVHFFKNIFFCVKGKA